MTNKDNFIYMLTEPHTNMKAITGFPRETKLIYHRIVSDQSPEPRAAILAAKNVEINSLDRWCSRDCAVAMTKIGNVDTVLLILYLDIRKPVISDWLTAVLDLSLIHI